MDTVQPSLYILKLEIAVDYIDVMKVRGSAMLQRTSTKGRNPLGELVV